MKKTAAVILALSILSPALAQDIEHDDIPTQCTVVCSNLVTVSEDCDRIYSNDTAEQACMCSATNAREVLPLCAACVSMYDTDDDDDRNDNGQYKHWVPSVSHC
jgi:hypothetical protein